MAFSFARLQPQRKCRFQVTFPWICVRTPRVSHARPLGVSCSNADGFFNPTRREWELTEAHAHGVGDSVADGSRSRALRAFSRAQERLAWPVNEMDLDQFRKVGKAQDRVGAPVATHD